MKTADFKLTEATQQDFACARYIIRQLNKDDGDPEGKKQAQAAAIVKLMHDEKNDLATSIQVLSFVIADTLDQVVPDDPQSQGVGTPHALVLAVAQAIGTYIEVFRQNRHPAGNA